MAMYKLLWQKEHPDDTQEFPYCKLLAPSVRSSKKQYYELMKGCLGFTGFVGFRVYRVYGVSGFRVLGLGLYLRGHLQWNPAAADGVDLLCQPVCCCWCAWLISLIARPRASSTSRAGCLASPHPSRSRHGAVRAPYPKRQRPHRGRG